MYVKRYKCCTFLKTRNVTEKNAIYLIQIGKELWKQWAIKKTRV